MAFKNVTNEANTVVGVLPESTADIIALVGGGGSSTKKVVYTTGGAISLNVSTANIIWSDDLMTALTFTDALNSGEEVDLYLNGSVSVTWPMDTMWTNGEPYLEFGLFTIIKFVKIDSNLFGINLGSAGSGGGAPS